MTAQVQGDNMKASIAATRRSFAVFVCMMLAVISMQVQAQTCTGTPQVSIDPVGQTVPESTPGAPTTVQLTGVTKKTGATFSWAQTAGPAVTLVPNASVSNPTFTAPSVGSTFLRFQLTVLCSTGNAGIATTDINVTDVVTNAAPTALASASPANAHEGNLVTLDGSESYDLDGSPLTYAWEQIDGIPEVVLTDANAAGSIVTFFAPNTPVATGATLTFRLTVSDGSLTGTTDKSVNILWTNDPPVASLVCPADGVFVVDEGDLVTLDGSGSSDADGSIVSYSWAQAAGLPNLGIGALDTASISFNAPSLGYQQLGSLSLTLTVTDDVGATAEAVCRVWINDVTPPAITVPDDVVLEADFAGGKAFSYAVTALDAVDDQVPYPLACVPPSGSDFPLAAVPVKAGTTMVACQTADSAGNAAAASFDVTVQDTTPPVITVPVSFAIEATGPDGATANYTAATLDAVDGAGEAVCSPASGSVFAIETVLVTCNASDARENVAGPVTFELTVHDTTAPVIAAHGAEVVEATGPGGAVVDYAAPSVFDLVSKDLVASCLPASGSIFALGAHTVSCDAKDAAGNAATTTTFQVTVQDTTAPVIDAHADELVEATGPEGATVSYVLPSVSDLVSTDLVASCLPVSGSTFALGSHTVSCNASDGAGNAATTTTFQMTVQDTTAPVLSYLGDISAVADANSAAVVEYPQPTADDLVDGAVAVACTPASGSTFGVGTTVVECSTGDSRGNTATGTFKVHVNYAFAGFFRPIDNSPTYNTVKPGSAVPVKFSLGGNQGPGVMEVGYPKSGPIACTASDGDAVEETVVAGSSSLQYDASTDQYIYVWKTEKSWSGCRILQLRLRDGSTKSALFKFK